MGQNVQTQIQTQEQIGVQVLTPQQLLEVHILELSTLELEERVRSEVQDNPALEDIEQETAHDEDENNSTDKESDADSAELFDDYDGLGSDYGDTPQSSTASNWMETTVTGGESFLDIVKGQLSEFDLNKEDTTIAEYIAASLEESGYLLKEASEIAYELEIYHYIETTAEHVSELIRLIQGLDPAGIGARDLQECLLLQIERKLSVTPDNTVLLYGKTILKDLFQDFIHKRWDKISAQLQLNQEQSGAILEMLTKLNPLPGNAIGHSGSENISITPDFLVDVQGGNVSFTLNNGRIPTINVSKEYEQMLAEQINGKDGRNKEAALFLKQKIDAAKGFIQAVQQRQNTLTKVMRAITTIQHNYFLDGDESCLKPMVLKDVAELTGLDISTVSRACAGKYMQTDWGIFPLKFFFTDGKKSDDGLEVSVRHIHNLIKEIIENEDSSSPLTDQQIVEILNAKGFQVARRTVVKYRTALGVPVARLRRKTV